MSSSHSSLKSYSRSESFKFWAGGRVPPSEGQDPDESPSGGLPVVLEISDRAKALLAGGEDPGEVKPADQTETFEISHEEKLKIKLLECMWEALTGKKIKFYVMEKIKLEDCRSDIKIQRREASGGRQSQGWGLEYDFRESYFEQEKLSFNAQGVVKTADGREIKFSVQMNMSREFAFQHNISIRAGDAAVDPLVINYDGLAPGLTEAKFSFDLDADGELDQISFVRPGSGLLALDLNGDGRVNDGRELFGPATGDGFAELAGYDLDGNRWIDENDPVYERLRIWTKDADGNDVLMALGQRGIGAVYLGGISAPFELKDSGNNLLGKVRQAGICIKEDGSAATVQQIDLVV